MAEPRQLVPVTSKPHPVSPTTVHAALPEGLTVREMVERVVPDAVYAEHAVAFSEGWVIPVEWWDRVRPRANSTLEVCVVPRGGDAGKNILRVVASIAVLALAAVTFGAGGALGTPLLGGLFTAGQALSAVITVGGMLAINALIPNRPPSMGNLSGTGGRDSPTLFVEGARNRARPFSPVPVVLGRYRATPPFGAQPTTEVLGDKQYLRLLFVWGVGPLEIDTDSLRIGQTPLSSFDGVEAEHRTGYSDDEPLTLYSDTILEESLQIQLSQSAGFQVRTSEPNADELSVDLTFPRGLVEFDDQGDRTPRSVTVEIQYRETGTSGDWLTPAFTAKTVPDAWIDETEVTFTHQKTAAVRHGFRWPVATPGATYDVRIRRTSADTNDTQIIDEVALTALRTIVDEDPVQSNVPVAKTALRIQATEQLSGVVEEFNGIVTSRGDDWSGSGWVADQQVRNPAALFRLLLQGAGVQKPLPDSRLDLAALGEWYEFCEDQAFRYDRVHDFAGSMYEALADVCAAGRAAPAQVDGKWTVVIDEPRPTPVSHVTPRNSSQFRVERAYVDPPHAWRIRFPNEDDDYRQDERRVYSTGFDASTATRFEALELPGVTNPDQVFRLGRYRILQSLVNSERWTFKQDMEFLTYERGDRIAVTHDVLSVGLAFGRVKSMDVGTNGDVAGITLDETVTVEAGKTYGVAVRTVDGGVVTRQVSADTGQQTELDLVTVIEGSGGEPTVEVGNLVGFGLLSSETDDATVVAIQPDPDLTARVACVPYRPSIYDADSETIPPFTSNLTPVVTLPAVNVRGVESGAALLARGPGESVRARIAVDFDPFSSRGVEGVSVRVEARPSATGEPFSSVLTVEQETSSKVVLSGVQDGETWDLRLRFEARNRLPGPWTYPPPHQVVGKSGAPAGLTGFNLSVFGGTAYLRWDRPTELDVTVGGSVRFRHSPALAGATWATSTSIGQSAHSLDLIASLPLKPGTYLARVFDSSGIPSDDVAAAVTKQASVIAFGSEDTLDEDPDFGGSHSNTTNVDPGVLKLSGSGLFDDIPDLDAVSDLDSYGGIASSGTYDFLFGFDLGTVTRVRLTSRLEATSVNLLDAIDDRTDPIDDWESFDGADQGVADARVEVRQTDDDPAGSSPDWSEWNRLDSAEFEARGFDFRAILTTGDPAYNVHVTDLGVDAETVT